jgi:hypothetical protein
MGPGGTLTVFRTASQSVASSKRRAQPIFRCWRASRREASDGFMMSGKNPAHCVRPLSNSDSPSLALSRMSTDPVAAQWRNRTSWARRDLPLPESPMREMILGPEESGPSISASSAGRGTYAMPTWRDSVQRRGLGSDSSLRASAARAAKLARPKALLPLSVPVLSLNVSLTTSMRS